MATTPHPLDPVLDFFEGRHNDRNQAHKMVRDYIFRKELSADPASHAENRLLVYVLANCIKPIFKGDLEKQVEIDRLVGAIRQGEGVSNYTLVQSQIREVGKWLRYLRSALVVTQQFDPVLRGLLQGVREMGGREPWLEKESEALVQGEIAFDEPEFWSRLHRFANKLVEHGNKLYNSWMEERKTFLNLVSELADHMHEMRQNTGGIGRRMGDALQRLHNSRTLEDLQQLRQVLVREAEDLTAQTQQLQQSLEEGRQKLQETREQLTRVMDELEQTRAESMSDPLTGIPNRRAFARHLEREVARSLRHDLPLCLIIFDLDHFKQVNDTYGHPVGDKVLVTIAERTQRLLRKSDIFARYGGEEFILLLPETGVEAALQVAEKLRAGFAALLFRTGQNTLTITASLGLCLLQPGMEPDHLVQCADKALYQAKQSGRNRVVVAESGMTFGHPEASS